MGITEDPYVAYCFDEAVWTFGTEIESRMNKAGKSRRRGDSEEKQNQRRQLALEKALGIQPKFATPPGVK